MDGPKSLIEHFSSVQDPRIDRTKKHLLTHLIHEGGGEKD